MKQPIKPNQMQQATLNSMLQKKSTGVEPYYLDDWLPAHNNDEARAEKLVSNNIKCYV
jgi:hypothetical protein